MKPNGLYYYPAHEWGLKVHDTILEVEDKPIHSEEELHQRIHDAAWRKGDVLLKINRHGDILIVKTKPFFSTKTNDYRIGVKIRALDDGIGTLTFYDPLTKKFGAMGHPLCRVPHDPITHNTIVLSNVLNVQKGSPHNPGKKLGYLNKYNEFTGNLEINSEVGIFGRINGEVKSPFFETPIPIGLKKEIRRDRASIYTVVQGNEIEKFNISIYNLKHQEKENRDLEVVIEDKELLQRTGGIVCGMSGSPIVQDGKLIGAISYLTTLDYTTGYGVSIENMLIYSGLINSL
jgi:stage IV sporulation protein B